MKKNSWLVAIVAACALLFSQASYSVEIPSSASAFYETPSRMCWLTFQRYQGAWTQADLRCLSYEGEQTATLPTLYTAGQCPNSSFVIPFDARALTTQDKAGARLLPGVWFVSPDGWRPAALAAGGEAFVVIGIEPMALHVLVGTDPTALANGIGSPQSWLVRAPLPSPWPYTCGTAPATVARPPRSWLCGITANCGR